MKKIEKEYTETKVLTTYESIDGKIFYNREDCEKWENSREGTLLASVKKNIKMIDVCGANYFAYGSDDDRAHAIVPKSLEDIVLINAWVEAATGSCNFNRLTSDCVNKIIVINFGYDYDFFEWTTYEQSIKDVENNFNCIKSKLCEDGAV